MSDDSQEEELNSYVSGFVKFSLCFFNFLMWIFGLCLIALGIWATVEEQRYRQQIGASNLFYVDISIGLILAGIIIFLVPLLGFLGALRENIILLRIFGVIVGIIVGVEILLTVLAFIFWEKLKAYAERVLVEQAVVQYQDNDDLRFILDSLQEFFGCCGVGASGYKDWSQNVYFNCETSNPSHLRCAVPYSCCKVRIRQPDIIENYMCGFGTLNVTVLTAASTIYTKGCVLEVVDTLKRNSYAVGGILIAIALCQVMSFIMSDYMISRIKSFCKDCESGTIKKRKPRSRRRSRSRRRTRRTQNSHEEP